MTNPLQLVVIDLYTYAGGVQGRAECVARLLSEILVTRNNQKVLQEDENLSTVLLRSVQYVISKDNNTKLKITVVIK